MSLRSPATAPVLSALHSGARANSLMKPMDRHYEGQGIWMLAESDPLEY
jgi:hypothetical protein